MQSAASTANSVSYSPCDSLVSASQICGLQPQSTSYNLRNHIIPRVRLSSLFHGNPLSEPLHVGKVRQQLPTVTFQEQSSLFFQAERACSYGYLMRRVRLLILLSCSGTGLCNASDWTAASLADRMGIRRNLIRDASADFVVTIARGTDHDRYFRESAEYNELIAEFFDQPKPKPQSRLEDATIPIPPRFFSYLTIGPDVRLLEFDKHPLDKSAILLLRECHVDGVNAHSLASVASNPFDFERSTSNTFTPSLFSSDGPRNFFAIGSHVITE